MSKKPPSVKAAPGCEQTFICPLSKLRVGAACRIKQLSASPETHALCVEAVGKASILNHFSGPIPYVPAQAPEDSP